MNTIIEEIRKRIKAQRTDGSDAYETGQNVGLSYALDIIDEVEKEHPVPADLEAEINREIQKLRTAPCYDELRNFALHFHEAGMLAERERLMKEAPVADVVEMHGSTGAEYPFVLTLGFLKMPRFEFSGKPVRVIIEEIKEDGK